MIKPVIALFPSDEMRHSYETAVFTLGEEVLWFSSLNNLLAYPQEPLAVLVDLDCLSIPWDPEIELLTHMFSKSDLIGFSSNHSAHIALRCIHSGFSDFLLKPVSPEEFAWSIFKSRQRQDLFKRLDNKETQIIKAITEISTSTTRSQLSIHTLQYLHRLFKGSGAAWIMPSKNRFQPPALVCSWPQNLSLDSLPKARVMKNDQARIFRKGNLRKVYFPCKSENNGGIFLWGISQRIKKRAFLEAQTIAEHAEVCLLNLQKFEEIKQQTFIDELTGLYNSRYLKFALNTAMIKYRQSQKPFSVLFIDIDHFKWINDKHGHLVGSSFLVAIGKTIQNSVRDRDFVFRYGGDEFIVLLHNTPLAEAKAIAERVRREIEKRTFVLEKRQIRTTVSVGIAVFPDHAKNTETLLRLADEAMYQVKHDSRNAVHIAPGPTA